MIITFQGSLKDKKMRTIFPFYDLWSLLVKKESNVHKCEDINFVVQRIQKKVRDKSTS